MDMLFLIVGILLAMWFLGFLTSTRKLASIANRQVQALELAQGATLKKKYNEKTVKDIKSYLNNFDSEDWDDEDDQSNQQGK